LLCLRVRVRVRVRLLLFERLRYCSEGSLFL
jgi:hypothetical protein